MSKRIKVYLYVSDFNWNKETRNNLLSIFEEFDAKSDEKAAIGAGASGPLPELNVLLVVKVALGIVAGGFLQAMGADAWETFKKALRKARDVKPDRLDPNLPEEMRVPQKSDLIWWIRFENKEMLIHLPNNSGEWAEALNKLPQEVDNAYKENPSFIRLMWMDGEWKAL